MLVWYKNWIARYFPTISISFPSLLPLASQCFSKLGMMNWWWWSHWFRTKRNRQTLTCLTILALFTSLHRLIYDSWHDPAQVPIWLSWLIKILTANLQVETFPGFYCQKNNGQSKVNRSRSFPRPTQRGCSRHCGWSQRGTEHQIEGFQLAQRTIWLWWLHQACSGT